MGFIQGEGRTQGTLFPVILDELIPQDHICRVIDAFVDRLDMAGLEFERAEPGETGRPGYDPRDLLKLYLYGYLQPIRSSRRLENECRRNVELILQRVHPEDAALVQQTIERATQDEKDFDHEYRLMMPDGSLKHLHVVARALNDESGTAESLEQ
jgi:hypothetical protein